MQGSDAGDAGNMVFPTIVWKDSLGKLAPVLALENASQRIQFMDVASKAVWSWDINGGIVWPAASIYPAWSNGNCTGTEYIYFVPPPRYAIGPVNNNYYVVPDDAAPMQVAWQSTGVPNSCNISGGSGWAILFSTLKQVNKPTAPGTPPYHPELL